MKVLRTIGEPRSEFPYRCEYEKNQHCPKCDSHNITIEFVSEEMTVEVFDHVLRMPKDGFITHCDTCGFEFIQTISEDEIVEAR